MLFVRELGPCAAGQPLLGVAQQLARGHLVIQQGHQQISQAIALCSDHDPHVAFAPMRGPPSGDLEHLSNQAS